jgi:hypothetical protein
MTGQMILELYDILVFFRNICQETVTTVVNYLNTARLSPPSGCAAVAELFSMFGVLGLFNSE